MTPADGADGRLGESGRKVLETERQYLAPAMTVATGIVWDWGWGSEVYDVDGRRYVDFTSGVLVTNVGHCHPHVVDAVQRQAARLLNCYVSPHPLRAELAERLSSLVPEPLNRVLLLTTGAEAVEAAVKLARRATGKTEILGFQGAFHGRTYMAMTVGGLGGVKEGFGPLVGAVLHAPFPYPYRCAMATTTHEHDCTQHSLEAIETVLATQSTGDVAAVVLEPYLGAAGSLVAPPDFAQGLRRLCDRRGMLLIVDEVQSGFGRTGTMFAFEQWEIVPDIVVLGKGIASGVPMSAVLTRSDLAAVLPGGSLSSTYGGNPLACAAALATIDVIEKERLPERAKAVGGQMLARLQSVAAETPLIGEVRGLGMALGVELVRDPVSKLPAPEEAKRVVDRAIKNGVALIPPIGLHGNVIRISPPLTTPSELIEEGLAAVIHALREVSLEDEL